MEVYEHISGGIFFSRYSIEEDALYCNKCGGWDIHLGNADTWEEVLALVTDIEDDGSDWCRYSEEYLKRVKADFESALTSIYEEDENEEV